VKTALLIFFAALLSAVAQINFPTPAATNQAVTVTERAEQIRAQLIQQRRLICGRIVKLLPEGVVIDSGYTNLLLAPLNRAWFTPATAVVPRDHSLVESQTPDAVCVGLVFLTDLPKTPGAKPKQFDYVCLEGFPMGQFTYTSVADLQRTVRKFSTKINLAVRAQLEAEAKAAEGK
jgi:hypothetical protein